MMAVSASPLHHFVMAYPNAMTAPMRPTLHALAAAAAAAEQPLAPTNMSQTAPLVKPLYSKSAPAKRTLLPAVMKTLSSSP